MTTTLAIAGWLVAIRYSIKAGGLRGVIRALRSPDVPRRYKIALALCALPIPGPFDELAAALLLRRIERFPAQGQDER